MAGKHITKQQAELYMKYRNKGLTQEACAAKVGMSSRSGHTIEVGKHHTQQPKRPRDYKTRVSPIDAVWEDDLEPMLRNNPDLQPQTLFIYLQRQYQDSSGNPLYNESILRTLQKTFCETKYWASLCSFVVLESGLKIENPSNNIKSHIVFSAKIPIHLPKNAEFFKF